MMWLASIEQFQMQCAPRLIGKSLKKFPGQSKPECAGHILVFLERRYAFMGQHIHSPPDKVWAAAQIKHASSKALVHGNVRLAAEWIPGIKTGAIAAYASLIAQGFCERLTQNDSTIFNGVMSINLDVSITAQSQIQHRMLRQKLQHVIEKRYARPH